MTYLDRRIATAVEDLTGLDALDSGHFRERLDLEIERNEGRIRVTKNSSEKKKGGVLLTVQKERGNGNRPCICRRVKLIRTVDFVEIRVDWATSNDL